MSEHLILAVVIGFVLGMLVGSLWVYPQVRR